MRILFVLIIGAFVYYLVGGSFSGITDKFHALLSGSGVTVNINLKDAVEYGKETMDDASDRAAKIKAGVEAIHSGSVMIRKGMTGEQKAAASGEVMTK